MCFLKKNLQGSNLNQLKPTVKILADKLNNILAEQALHCKNPNCKKKHQGQNLNDFRIAKKVRLT